MRKQKRYFQWLDGDNAGQVSILDDISYFDGEYFYNFEDGESCNERFVAPMTRVPKTLEGKVVVEIADPNDKWRIETISARTYVDPKSNDSYEIPPLEDIVRAEGKSCEIVDSAIGRKKYYPPRYKGPMKELPSVEEWIEKESEPEVSVVETSVKQTAVEQTFPEQKKVVTTEPINSVVMTSEPLKTVENPIKNDPVYIILKSCKKQPTDIELSMNISLPDKSVYDMVSNNFEDGINKFIDCVIEDIDTNTILDALREALVQAYAVGNNQ